MVRENKSLDRRVEVGTWLIAREVRRQFDAVRPSSLVRVRVRRPDRRQRGGVDAPTA